MEIQTVASIYFILLIAGIVISFWIGFRFTRKFQDHTVGFFSALIVSLIILMVVVQGFKMATADLLMGTIPWIVNKAVAIVFYPFYLAITWFLLKRFNNLQRG